VGMDIRQYLSERKEHFHKGMDTIRNFEVFDFNYIPEKPLMREEVKPVIDALLRYQQTGIANNVLILGSRGSGKSVLAKYLMRVLSDQSGLHFAYANCRQHNTSFKILACLLGLRPRGCSLDELWRQFEDAHREKTVFVLDEVDLMSDKDRRKDILYLLSRSPRNYMAMLLSNNPKFLSPLDESIKSTLQPAIVHFGSYGAAEVEEILTERAKAGLTFLPEPAIREIAAMAVKNTNSDVRVAIKTLYLWALEPEVPLKDHFEIARRDIMFDVVRDLNDMNLLILKAALAQRGGFVKEVYEAYRRISAECNEEAYSYVHFYSNLAYMQSLGLILLISTKVDRAYTNTIQLAFDPTILSTVWQSRFE
jgi:Cdc6-like AAA superfamily ATPase